MAFTADEFEFLKENTSLFLIILDDKGNICRVNKRCEILFSLPTDKIIGESIYTFLLDKDESDFKETIAQLSENKKQLKRTFGFATVVSEAILYIKFDLVYNDNKIYASGIDVTEENEEHNFLKTLSRLTKTGAWHYDPIHDQVYFSDECYRLHDLEPGTSLSMTEALFYYPEASRERIKNYWDNLIHQGIAYDYTDQIITKKGEQKWIRVIAEAVKHKDKVVFVNGSFADITERHNYLEKLKYNEETKRLALKGIRSGLFDHHFDRNATYYSSDLKKMLGLPLDKDFISPDLLQELIHPDDLQDSIKRHIKGLKKEGNSYLNHYRIKDKDGEYKYYEVHGYRKKDKNNRTTRMIGNLIDIHQKKINERTIAENQSRLLAMVNNGFAYTVLLNTVGEILMADENSINIIKRDFNVDPTLTVSRFIDVMPLNFKNTFAHEFNEALKGETVKKEIERITHKGSIQWLESKYTPIKDLENNINSILVSFHDITEQKSAELAIKQAHIKEQELSSLKSNILSNFSHEIRTPLNGIITISNLLLLGEENPNDRKKLATYLDESKERLLATINNLSHYSEIETIQKNLNYIEADINYTVETSYREYRHFANSKNLDYILELDESCPSAVIDVDIFHTAINNIIHNAIKYTKKGKVIVNVKAKKRSIRISIKDSGIGIGKDSLRKIFDPFVQESIGLSRKYEGTGIGLSLSKRYIEILGGKIKVISKLEKGTKFIITIPKKI
ncbi:PAS domain S-box protein [Aquimarina sp. BL5]|uniref:PAS domain S-box protein n=1 Tax=Aquimarina sp. BL5 TaxID=1714860 RepID=UPI000EA9A36E|nr:PAS domain S-box protein [Aquimarina sp. BL5]RKN00535.1 PAS domain S-box protein [Aquimarina sp. BL5]